jgi:hypothetical protein
MPDRRFVPLTKHTPEKSCGCQPTPAKEGADKARRFVARNWSAPVSNNFVELQPVSRPSLGEWDTILARAQTHAFCISGMAFQDAWNLDLERLRDCYIHIASPDGRLIPFCAYNLTDQSGRPVYRPLAVQSHSTSS